MKGNCLILTGLVIACIALLQISCQQQTGAAEVSKTMLATPEPAADTTKDATMPKAEVTPAVKTAKTETLPEANKPVPKIEFEKVLHDFGLVGPGTKNVCEFKFTNTGNGLLKMGKIKATCGCTVAKLSKLEYEPGESGSIQITYSASRGKGKASKNLFVSSNDKTAPRIKLTVQASIGVKVDFEPRRLNLSPNNENAGCPEVTIRSTDGQPFTITHLRSVPDGIAADVNSSVKTTEFVFQPKVDITKLKKGVNGHIEVGLTHPECKKITIPFSVPQEFTISPPTIVIVNAEPQKPIKKEAWILSNYNMDFEIKSVSTKNNVIRVLSQDKVPGQGNNASRFKLVLEIIPPPIGDKPTMFTDELLVSMKSGEQIKVPCNGFYSAKAIQPTKKEQPRKIKKPSLQPGKISEPPPR